VRVNRFTMLAYNFSLWWCKVFSRNKKPDPRLVRLHSYSEEMKSGKFFD
jgi:hypothetical protein